MEIIRLVDEVINTPMKSVFKLGRKIMMINQTTFLATTGILLILNCIAFIPGFGVLALIASIVFLISSQIYIGRLFDDATDIDDFSIKVKQMDPISLIYTHRKAAIGSLLAWIILIIPIIFISIFLGGNQTSIGDGGIDILSLVLFGLIISYVYPLILNNMIQANGFSEGFRSIVTLFSSKTWSNAFKKNYFKYIATFGFISLIGISLLLFIISLINGGLFYTGLFGIGLSLIIATLVIFIYISILSMVAILAKEMTKR